MCPPATNSRPRDNASRRLLLWDAETCMLNAGSCSAPLPRQGTPFGAVALCQEQPLHSPLSLCPLWLFLRHLPCPGTGPSPISYHLPHLPPSFLIGLSDHRTPKLLFPDLLPSTSLSPENICKPKQYTRVARRCETCRRRFCWS